MKKTGIIIAFAGLWLLWGCVEKEQPSYYVQDLVIDTEHNLAEGSYVQGVSLQQTCTVTVFYENAKGGEASFSAPVTNGMEILPQRFTLANGSGSVSLKVSGTPLELRLTYLQINIQYNGKTYLSSVEINVLEDLDPSGEIIFTIDGNDIRPLLDPATLPFTVTPSMTAVTAVVPDGLRAVISTDKQTGEGSVVLTPSASFIDGEIVLTASFGAREPQVQKIGVSAFASGNGTDASPWAVSDEKGLDKLRYALTSSFVLSSDINVSSNWNPVGSAAAPFNGKLNGASHTVSFNIAGEEDYSAFFAYAGASAHLEALKLKGSVEGKDYVAALAASSETALNADISEVTVLGDNHIAAGIASGAGKDADVIVFTEVPSTVNIPAGETSFTGLLGLAAGSGEVVFDAGTTGVTLSYDSASGQFTVQRTDSFNPGAVSFYARLGSDRVRSRVHTINITSKNMYESGTGTPEDPYLVMDYDQLSATMNAYPAASIKLGDDADISTWATLDSFTGTLDGDGHKVSGLTVPFVGSLGGKIFNLAFKEVNITAGGSGGGTVANNVSGTIDRVSVSGTVSAGAASAGDTGLGAIAGQASGSAVISNCCSNMEISVSGTNFATGGIVGVIKASGGITIENCTVAGNISITSNATKVGGILGRKTNASQGSKDIIRDCLVSGSVNVSGTGSNMVGGVFGALQGATVSGDYVGGITIVRTAFTGSVSAGTAVGGIGGVCCSVTDCFVSGSVQATNNTGSTGGSGGVVSAAKGDVTRCVVSGSRISGTNLAGFSTAGIISKQNGNAPAAKDCAVIGALLQNEGKTILGATANLSASGNKWWGVKYLDEAPYLTQNTDQDGEAFAAAPTQADFEAMGYDFTSVWKWNSAGYPELRNAGCPETVKNM